MIPPFVYVVALVVAMSMGMFWQVKRNGQLSEQLATVTQEKDDAVKQATSLVEASKRHAKELAGARAKASRQVASISSVVNDGCLDAVLPADIERVLNDEDGEADAASGSAAKNGAKVSRKNVQGRNEVRR